MFTAQLIIAVSVIAFLTTLPLHAKPAVIAEEILDLTNPKTHSQITTHDWTLGATGARGWCQVSHGFG